MNVSPGEFDPEISATDLVASLQELIGQYVVEKAAADLYMKKMQKHIAGLESQLTRNQMQVSDTAAE